MTFEFKAQNNIGNAFLMLWPVLEYFNIIYSGTGQY